MNFKRRIFFLIIIILIATKLISQTVSFEGLGDHIISFSTGISSEPEWISPKGGNLLETRIWIGLTRNYPTSRPGYLTIDFTDLSISKRRLGSYKTLKSVSINYKVSGMEELELSDENILSQNPDPAFVGQTANLGALILTLEDENGFDKEFNFGLFYLVNCAREISYVNPEYVYEVRNFMDLPSRTWYLKEMNFLGARPIFMPEDMEFYYFILEGDQ